MLISYRLKRFNNRLKVFFFWQNTVICRSRQELNSNIDWLYNPRFRSKRPKWRKELLLVKQCIARSFARPTLIWSKREAWIRATYLFSHLKVMQVPITFSIISFNHFFFVRDQIQNQTFGSLIYNNKIHCSQILNVLSFCFCCKFLKNTYYSDSLQLNWRK